MFQTSESTHYDLIADEYYSERHITSRNFDQATKNAFLQLSLNLPIDGLVLEFGAGRGRSTEYLGISSRRIIQSDSSRKMLLTPDREECLLRTICEARNTPFLDSEFSVCTAFLCDPFWSVDFLKEAFRVTTDNGYFIATMPSYSWGIPLRNKLGFKPNATTFITVNGDHISVPSILVSKPLIISQLENAGFFKENIQVSSWRLPGHINSISPHITISADLQRISQYELDIIDVIVARK